nr:polysaccharide biosynthesis protein [Planctomycetota bacterium]
AYKHVPLVESNPYAGVRNNVLGFRNLLAAVDASGVERLVLISTDKAVSPTNVMGASKRVCELLMRVHAGASTCCAVRFGNVLGSSGSVVPLFLDQIQRGGPVTVTSPEVTRYFMLIPEAVELVLQAGALAEGRDIFLLDMGDPIRIDYLARQLIFMTGHVPDRDIAISYTGLRPGEKMTEELLVTGSEAETSVDGLMQARETVPVHDDVSDLVDELLRGADQEDAAAFVSSLRTLVPEWRPDVAWQERLAAIGAQIERDTESIRRPG